MPKELPYFQFEPAEWLAGDISLESDNVQGVFIQLCAVYWQRECKLSYDQATNRFNPECIDRLIEINVIQLMKNGLRIKFLNLQFAAAKRRKKKRKSDGKKGGKKSASVRLSKSTTSQATLEQDSTNTQALRIEKKKEEERKEDKSNLNTSVKPQKVFTPEVVNCFLDCLAFFPNHLHPKDSDTSWKDCIEKLNRIDGIPFEKIVQIVKAAREDDFWSKNFLSLPKLRKKDKNGVPYVVVFNERFRSQQHSKIHKLKQTMAEIYKKRTGEDW